MMKWTETIEIDAAAGRVFEAQLDQEHVMEWSAWPEATGFACGVEGDGRSPGSEIVFRNKKGDPQGRQRIVEVYDLRVTNRLENKGPFGTTITPRVDFAALPLGENRTRADLEFEAEIPLPFGLRHLVQAVMSRWARKLHVKDLEQLKTYVESGRVASGGV
ncbi:MAG: SRPBCC family protein [Acidimicrobiales bacterium]